ncbi:unnamed protein product [Rotaria socialis]|uniref:Uncharacterized protein n=1 Tax=Rotaria socialis TaxID=392032 RepID=A0A820PYA9_9BILA|nr:unnamed protein product [Rotaria socialis]CAF4414473.1 unnamed protein product [Rotaria socialis]
MSSELSMTEKMLPASSFTSTSIRPSYYIREPNFGKYDNIEDIAVVWLDSHSNVSLDCFDMKIRLRYLINHLLTFHSISTCLEYMNSDIEYEKVFFIVSGSDSEIILPEIHLSPKIHFNYIFCNDKEKYENLSQTYSKIRGIFNDKDSLLKKLISDITSCLSNLLPISILSQASVTQKSLRDLSNESARFMWFQMLIEILIKMEHTDEAKSDLIEICRKQYKNDLVQSKRIDEFEKTYTADKAASWYTRDSFVYRLLNKALRTENIDIIYKFRSFIADLHQQLSVLQSTEPISTDEFLYRGQKLPIEELQYLQKNINGYLSMNTFVSFSRSSQAALLFAGKGEDRPQLESVLFQTEVNDGLAIFANIENVSYYKDEGEFLFTIGSVFRIADIEHIGNIIWVITLVIDTNANEDVEKLSKYLKKYYTGECSLLKIAEILFQIGEYDRAEHYCKLCNEQLHVDHQDRCRLNLLFGDIFRAGKGDFQAAEQFYVSALKLAQDSSLRASVLAGLGRLEDETGKYEAALTHLTESFDLNLKEHPNTTNEIVAKIYADIALVYRHKLDFTKSLEYYNQSLEINLQLLPDLHPSLANLYNNIAYLNTVLGKYDEAMKSYEISLKIQLKSLPKTHPDIATVYNNMAILHECNHDSQLAMEMFCKSLELFSAVLPSDHPTIATLYHNIGTSFHEIKNYPKAITHLEKALDLRKKILPLTHLHIAESYESLAYSYYGVYDYQKTLDFCNMALEIDPTRAALHECIGETRSKQHDYDGALVAFRKAIDLCNPLMMKDNRLLARIHFSMAQVLLTQEKLDEALECYKTVSLVPLSYADQDTLAVANMHLADIYTYKKQFRLAIESYKKCLDYNSECVPQVEMYNNLAANYFEVGQEEADEEYYRKALEIRKKILNVFPLDDQDLGITYSIIGTIYYKLNEYDLCLEHKEKARDHLLKNVSMNNDILTNICESIASFYELRGEMEKAIENGELLLKLQMDKFDSENPKNLDILANLCNNLGSLYHQVQNIEKAIECVEQAVTFERIAKISNPELYDNNFEILQSQVITCGNLAALYEEAEATEKQIIMLNRCLEIYSKLVLHSQQKTDLALASMAEIFKMLGGCYSKLDDHHMAFKSYQQALYFFIQLGSNNETMSNEYKENLENAKMKMNNKS